MSLTNRTTHALIAASLTLVVGCVDTEPPEWWQPTNQTQGDNVGLTAALEGQECTPAQLSPPTDSLRIHLIDVGQGDAIWVQTPTGENILIDSGDLGHLGGFFDNRTAGADYVQAYLSAFDVLPGFSFDAAIVTHAHSDHYGGFLKLFGDNIYNFEKFVDPGLDSDNVSYEDLLESVTARINPANYFRPAVTDDGSSLVREEGDDTTLFGPEVRATVVNAESATRLGGASNSRVNNTSVVLLLEFAGKKALFMGDAELDQEYDLLQRAQSLPYDLEANFLKVGHHGSDTASSTLFLDAVFRNIPGDERYAFISSGRRSFSGTQLPNADTVFLLRQQVAQINIFSTEAGDNAKNEDLAPGDDNILAVINPDGSLYACYVPCSEVPTCE